MWAVETKTEDIVAGILSDPQPYVPTPVTHIGATEVRWWEGRPGDAIVMAAGGSAEDRAMAEQIVAAQLEAIGYKRAQFTFDANHKTAGWPDIMEKAKRLIQSGAVTILRNGYNTIVGHVEGDHGEYNTEIGREDPQSRSITTWQCECPWDQYAWQRTRKWKKYEGRPCAHVMALYWKALSTPLDDYDPEQHGPMGTGQKTGPPPPPPAGGGGGAPPAGPPSPVEAPPGGAPLPTSFGPQDAEGFSPPASPDILPKAPMDQLAEQAPPVPGATPAGLPANPSIVSVPGAKMPTPFNPTQFPGGTYSKTAAEEFVAPEIVQLKEDCYGMAEGKSDAHGNGQYRNVPAGKRGEVLGQDPTTGWVEVIFPLEESSYLEPYHVKCYVDPKDLMHTAQQPPGPFVKRRSSEMESDHEWMTGQCAAWALAHQAMNPHLKFGFHWEEMDPWESEKEAAENGEDWDGQPFHRVQHVFTHDDQNAYDADGVHPMPYEDWSRSQFGLDHSDVKGTGMVEYGWIPAAEDWIRRNGDPAHHD